MQGNIEVELLQIYYFFCNRHNNLYKLKKYIQKPLMSKFNHKLIWRTPLILNVKKQKMTNIDVLTNRYRGWNGLRWERSMSGILRRLTSRGGGGGGGMLEGLWPTIAHLSGGTPLVEQR